MSKQNKRDEFIHTRVSKEEKAKLMKEAKQLGTILSRYTRKKLGLDE